jgi:hypothetical protein
MSRTARQVSQLSGELVQAPPFTVPFAPGFNLEAVQALDENPRFATVKIKAGKGNGGKGPNYSPTILQDLERQFNEKRPSGYKGHQDPDKVDYEWREPVTAWIGARYNDDEQALYVKGYVPQTAPELRAQLDLAATGADVINGVSIWGMRDVKDDEVTAFDLWSLDWTPKGRNGMEVELISVTGEMEDEEDDEVNREQVIATLTPDDVPESVKAAIRGELQTDHDALTGLVGEVRVILELDETSDSQVVIDAIKGLVDADALDEFQSRVSAQVTEHVAGELMQTAITERLMSTLEFSATDEEIAGEIATAKELPHIKALAGSKIPTVVTGGEAGGGNPDETRQGTSWA